MRSPDTTPIACRRSGRAEFRSSSATPGSTCPRAAACRSWTRRGRARAAGGDEGPTRPGAPGPGVGAVQVPEEPVARAVAGQRVALNLAGVAVDELRRGDVVSGRGAPLAPTYVLDAALELDGGERPVEHGVRVQVHHGTREAPARLAELGGRFWQLRLEQPLLAEAGDRLLVRRIAPPDTLRRRRVRRAAGRQPRPSPDPPRPPHPPAPRRPRPR